MIEPDLLFRKDELMQRRCDLLEEICQCVNSIKSIDEQLNN
jgi:hypothetical protein